MLVPLWQFKAVTVFKVIKGGETSTRFLTTHTSLIQWGVWVVREHSKRSGFRHTTPLIN